MHLATAAFILGSVAGAALAQPAADAHLRAKALGEVRNLAGKPWVGAKIVLVSRLGGERVPSGPVDRCETVTDERGRFRVPILVKRTYSLWAVGTGEPPLRTSAVKEGVIARVPVLLHEARKKSAPQRFEFDGLEPWAAQGPFHVRASAQAKSPIVVTAKLDAEQGVDVPALPGQAMSIEILDQQGLVLLRHAQTVGPRRRPTRLRVPKPKVHLIAVRDINTGKGVVGAAMMRYFEERFVKVAVTGPDGVAEVRLPEGTSLGYGELFARAPGYITAGVSRGQSRQVTKKTWKPLREGVAHHTNLDKGLAFRGRILIGGKPAMNLLMLMHGRAMHFNEKRSRSISNYRDVLRTDVEGRFAIAGCIPEASYRSCVDLLLDAQHVARLPAEWQGTLHHHVRDALALHVGEAGEVKDLGDIELTGFLPVDLTIHGPQGMPASGATVGSYAVTGNDVGGGFGADVRTADRLGRIRMLLCPGREIILVASHETGFRALLLRAPEPAVKAVSKLTVRLQPPFEISGVVKSEANDKPVSGMHLDRSINWRNRIMPNRIGVDLEEPGERDVRGVTIREPGSTHMREILQLSGHFPNQVTTDAEGRFKFLVPPYSMSYRISGRKSALGIFRQMIQEVVDVQEESVMDLEFRSK